MIFLPRSAKRHCFDTCRVPMFIVFSTLYGDQLVCAAMCVCLPGPLFLAGLAQFVVTLYFFALYESLMHTLKQYHSLSCWLSCQAGVN